MPARIRKPYRYPAHLSQSAPRKGLCPACRESALIGLWNALPLICDPEPLSADDELSALILGLRTWLVVGGIVYRRSASAIAAEAYPWVGHLLRSHRCGAPLPRGVKSATEKYPDKCPF